MEQVFFGIPFPENFPISTEHQQKLALLLFSSPSTSAEEAYGIVHNEKYISKIGILIDKLQCELVEVISTEDENNSIQLTPVYILNKVISKIEEWSSVFSLPSEQELALVCEHLKIEKDDFEVAYRKFRANRLRTASETSAFISESVKGQQETIDNISIAIQNFKLRLEGNLIPALNTLLIGPTGSGKGLLCKEASQILKVPQILINCAELVPEGIVGATISKIVKSEIKANESESFVILFDELCKLSPRYHGNDEYKPSIQNELLRFIDNNAKVRFIKGSEQYDNEKSISIDPNKQLIILSGAFQKIEDIVYQRQLEEFNGNKALIDSNNIIAYVNSIDIQAYGIIPELASRLSFISPMNKLSVKDIYNIMLYSRESELKKQISMFTKLGVDISITEQACWAISEHVVTCNLGARSITPFVTNLLRNVHLKPESYRNFKINRRYVDFVLTSNKYKYLFQQFETTFPDLIKVSEELNLNIDFVIDNFFLYKQFNH